MKKTNFGEIICTTGGRGLMIFLLYLVIFGILILISNIAMANPSLQFIAFIYIVLFSFFGWKALNRIQPSIFLVLPLIGWLIYFLLKFFLAIVVGMFVTPFVISKKIISAVQNKYNLESDDNLQD